MQDLINRQTVIDGVVKSCIGASNVVQAEANIIQYIKKIPANSVGNKETTMRCAMFKYGDTVRDIVTGFYGNVTGYADFYGKQQPQYLVETVDTTGRPIEQWVTANRLEKCDE